MGPTGAVFSTGSAAWRKDGTAGVKLDRSLCSQLDSASRYALREFAGLFVVPYSSSALEGRASWTKTRCEPTRCGDARNALCAAVDGTANRRTQQRCQRHLEVLNEAYFRLINGPPEAPASRA